MNHLGDTNKMVSGTPISDSTPHNVADLGMQIRRLERQLNAANVEIEEKRKDVVWLATEKAKLEERIKRLEEAGDAVAAIIGPPGSAHWADEDKVDAAWNNWTKAKESKL